MSALGLISNYEVSVLETPVVKKKVKVKSKPKAKKTINISHVNHRNLFEGGGIKLDHCYYCGSKDWLTKDHFFPRSRGGLFTVTCCNECNQEKGNLTPRQWIIHVERFDLPNKERIIAQTEKLLSETSWSIMAHLNRTLYPE